jgi:PBP1b-binding outer membrane lipoprotein LpoB
MKSKIVAMLIICVFVLAGCQGKSNSPASTSVATPNNATVNQSQTTPSASNNAKVTSSDQRDDTQYNFKPVKPGTVPQLSQALKTEVNTKMSSVINDINSSLQSLDDVKDIDLSPVN